MTLRPLSVPIIVQPPTVAGSQVEWFRSGVEKQMRGSGFGACHCELTCKYLSDAYNASALFVIRGFTEYHGVFVSDSTWDRPAGSSVDKHTASPLDHRQWYGQPVDPKMQVEDADITWIRHALPVATYMRNQYDLRNTGRESDRPKRFAAAVDAIYDCRYDDSLESILRHLWAGIETFFSGSKQNVLSTLAMRCALVLGREYRERMRVYDKVRELYQVRCAVVHDLTSRECAEDKLRTASRGSFELLRDLLTTQLDKDGSLANEDLLKVLLSAPSIAD
jgi:hypothetical protein